MGFSPHDGVFPTLVPYTSKSFFVLTLGLNAVKLSVCRREAHVYPERRVTSFRIPRKMSTTFAKKRELEPGWYVIDANGQVLGRMATRIANILRGKHKPTYMPFLDTGDHVIVVNAERIMLTGNKDKDKVYYRHSGYPGGIKEASAEEIRSKHPERLIESAVRGMLPKNRLGRAQFKKLKVYAGPDHPHQAQMPQTLDPAKDVPSHRTASASGGE